MNCVERFSHHSNRSPERCALWLTDGTSISYGTLSARAAAIQVELRSRGIKPGDPALLLLGLGVELYASIIALMAMGCPVLLVEPWLSVERIDTIIRDVGPRAFVTGSLGSLWGSRVSSIRKIPVRLNPKGLGSTTQALHVESVEESRLAILTFTSGTSGGTPKGVVRTQGYLLHQLEAFERHLAPGSVDWCIFANFAIANLGLGITSLIMPRNWSSAAFRAIQSLPKDLQPRSLTCGPAFLRTLLRSSSRPSQAYPSLETIHVGGALTDCDLFDEAFEGFPDAHFTHVYGSTEVEPVALSDAREAVRKSRERGLVQTLALGRLVPELSARFDQAPGSSGLWVTGPHVCPRYWGDAPENQTAKSTDTAGRVWHAMGDRIEADPDGTLWYGGRASQSRSEFELEQGVYCLLGHSRAFVQRDREGKLWLLGEGVVAMERRILDQFREIDHVEDLKILRDARHRARIDRSASLKKGARWLAG